MLCERCREREAVAPVIKIVDGEPTVMHICNKCAEELNSEMEKELEFLFPAISDFVSGMFSDFPSFHTGFFTPFKEEAKPSGVKEFKCPRCGLSYSIFQKTFQLGCSQCYETFKGQLEPMLRRIHGSSVHKGKVPSRLPVKVKISKVKIEDLEKRLTEAIKREEYEEAARLRDEIRTLEARQQKK